MKQSAVSKELAALIEQVTAKLKEEFGSDFSYEILGQGYPVARHNIQGIVKPYVLRPSPMEEIAAMDEGGLLSRKESLESYFENCRTIQQGIGSKERVWYHTVCNRLEKEFNHKIRRWE